jgi:nucleoside phosphorylase
MPPSRSYDLGLIFPSREVFECAREILTFDDPVIENGSFLYPFKIPGSELTGVSLVLFGEGQTGSAVAATNLLARFDLRLLALVGVAGSLTDELQLGDVIVAAGIDEYLHAARATELEFQVGGRSWRADRDLVSYANNFRFLPGDYQAWRTRVQSRRDPSLRSLVGTLTKDKPDYEVGQLASGVIKGAAEEFARWLLHYNRRRVALEMESAGVAEAIYQSGRDDLLVVRGISDFADGRKFDQHVEWRRYAALNAVDLLAAMVSNDSFPWPAPPVAGPSISSVTAPPSADTASVPPGHVFISHADDDAAAADRLRAALMRASVEVWDDSTDLLPGQDRRSAIRKAISDGAFVFLACFSSASLARTRSRHNEELMLAIDELRRRRFDQAWLIPVKLDDCEVPDIDIGGGRTLRSLVPIDLFGPRLPDQTQRLIKAVLMILGQS